MAQGKADLTLTFRRLSDAAAGDIGEVRGLFAEPAAFDEWAARWRQAHGRRTAIVSRAACGDARGQSGLHPRNHRIEAVISAAINDDYAPFEELLKVLAKPFEDQPIFRVTPTRRGRRAGVPDLCGTYSLPYALSPRPRSAKRVSKDEATVGLMVQTRFAPPTMRVGRCSTASTIRKPRPREFRFAQRAPTKLITLLGDIVVDALVFEFMGLAMLGALRRRAGGPVGTAIFPSRRALTELLSR